jgi:hypothetical protein
VERIFQLATASEIERHVREWMADRLPEDYIESYIEEMKT